MEVFFFVTFRMYPSLMPKGVEHWMPSFGITPDTAMYPSLMPKGVEHNNTEKAYHDLLSQCILR